MRRFSLALLKELKKDDRICWGVLSDAEYLCILERLAYTPQENRLSTVSVSPLIAR
jgi:hypothetical protein